MKSLLLLAALWPPASQSIAPAAAPASEPARKVELARLRILGVDAEAFAAALALRMPSVQLVPHDRELPDTVAPSLAVFVDVRPLARPDDGFAVTIVASDGRAWDRTVATEPGAPPEDVTRLLASHVGNLVSTIESGTTKPDREHVAIPAVPSVAPTCPQCPEPPREPAHVPPTSARPPPPPPPPAELGLVLGTAPVVGLGAPDDADRFVGWGGSVGLHVRHRSGFVGLAELRVLGRRERFDEALVRTRVGLGCGYAWRRGRFELETAAEFTVEPWTLRRDGSRSELADLQGQPRDGQPLLGGFVRVVPGLHFAPRQRLRIRFGPRFELAGSSAARDRGRVATLVAPDDGRLATLARLGGIELALGAELSVWFGVGRAGARRR